MLKQAMSKLKSLNDEIFKVFALRPELLDPNYRNFEKFTDDLVPFMLRQATGFLETKQPSDQTVLPEMLVRLLGDCINKPLPRVEARCISCSSVPDHHEKFRAMFAEDGDLVNELHMRVFRLACHMCARWTQGKRHHGCDDEHDVQSELNAISVLSRQITARINNIFKNGTSGLELPLTLRRSATFFPDYEGILDGLFIGKEYMDCLGQTALHRLFDFSHLRTIDQREAIAREMSNSHPYADILGRLPLHVAIQNGTLWYPLNTSKKLFIASSVNAQTVYGHTPLHYTRFRGGTPFAVFAENEILGLDPNLPDVTGSPAIAYLLKDEDAETIMVFLDMFEMDLNTSKGPNGVPLLCAVVRRGLTDVLEQLLNLQNINPNVVDDCGATPIHIAIDERNLQSLELLGKFTGLHWNKPDHRGWTPLHHAASTSDERFLQYILARSRPTDVNLGDEHGDRPLHVAISYGYDEHVKILLESVAVDVNAQNKEGMTPLIGAIMSCRTRTVELLLKDKRVNLDPKDCKGNAALGRAHLHSRF
jgi:ankyrin repeat protein